MHKLRETMTKELEAIERKGQLSMSDLDKVHKLTDTIKNIDKIEMLEEDGYSEDYEGGSSYRRGRGRKRDSMGRYSRDGGYYGGEFYGRTDGGRYSRDDGKDHLMKTIREMMDDVKNDREREAYRKALKELENA
jgi:hypothetical protein